MTIPELGKLESVRPRAIWPHEERDFTPWLAQNLHLLNESLDLDLELIDTESHLTGAGRVDILAKDNDRDALVIIENQLDSSDDDHFARLIGYAASREARILIWVTGGFYEWHRRMLDWLNAADGIDAYGVEVSAWRIGAALAPNCAASPGPASVPNAKPTRRLAPPRGTPAFTGRWWNNCAGPECPRKASAGSAVVGARSPPDTTASFMY